MWAVPSFIGDVALGSSFLLKPATQAASLGAEVALRGGTEVEEVILNSSKFEPWLSKFGQPSEGLGQLVKDLPRGHEARNELARLIREVRASGAPVSNKGLTCGTYAQFLTDPESPVAVLFRYQRSKLRILGPIKDKHHW